ncbi:Alpha/Beta hydrolase protein [Entophlyctis helioformis]|nr:Alpha/Beta hydrolase protein [Entophlyctis helioformis]
MPSASEVLLVAGAATAAAVLYAYYKVVPSNTDLLGSLADVRAASPPYPEKFWPTSAYADLPFGKTHYFLLGPENGKKVVFIHGISCPGPCFPEFLNGLADKGYRVLVYDHYGRGYSESPGTHYSEQLYVAQLALLLQKIGWTKTSVVGYSLGGAIAAFFISKYPEMVDRIVFVAPAGLMSKLPNTIIFTKIPILGPLIAHLVKLNDFMIKNHPGFLRAYFSTASSFKFGGNDDVFSKIEVTHSGKVIAIWGNLDKVVPFYTSKHLKELIPSVKLFVQDGWGHSIVAEIPQVLISHVHDHLSQA